MDQLTGNDGTDTLDYSDAISPGYFSSTPGISGISGIGNFPDSETGVFINLTGTKNTGDDGPVGAGGGKDYLYIKREEDHGLPGEASVAEPGSFERIVGSPFSDVIWGSAEAETIEAGPGADVVVGDGGADTIDGGADGDYLDGSSTATLTGGDSSIDSCVNPSGTPTACGSGHSIVPRSQEKIALGIQRPGAAGGEASAFLAGSKEGDQVSAHYNASSNSVVFTAENTTVAQRFAPIGCNAVVGTTVNCPLGNKELGALVLSGGGGADKLSFEPMSLQKPGSVELAGGSGADNLGGSNLEEMLTDSSNQEGGVEHLHSGEGDDELIQEDGSDEVIGGPGNDLLISSRICERDVIYGDVKGAGDSGSDNAQFHPVKEVGVFVNLINDHLGQTNQKNHVCPYASEPWYDQIHQINDLEGSPQPDVFEGDEHSNLLIGRGGQDVLFGKGGTDTLNAKDDAIDQNVNCGGDQGDLARVDNETEKNTVVHKCEKVTYEGADFPTRPGTDTISALSDEQVATSLAAGVPPPAAPSSDYPLDDNSGTSVENVVEEGEDGTYEAAGVGPSTNEPGPTLDVSGAMLETAETSAVELDGSNDYINLSEEGDPTESEASGYSVEMWVKFEAPPGEEEYLFSNMEVGEGTYLFRSPEGKLVFGTSSETGSPVVSTTEPVEDEEWHQVVGTLDGEEISLYVDGFPYKLGYGQSVFPEETESAESLVGVNPSMTHFLQGSVDEVVTYETALPETQIFEQLAQSKAEEPETQLAPEPETVDSDGDGVTNGVDNCPTVPNSAQTDTNLDGIGDACEPPDSDGDGVPDASDNCVGIYNPEQTDSNNDGIGDACADMAPKVTTTAPTNVKGTTGTLNGTVNPQGVSSTYQIEYGKTTSYGSKVPVSPSSVGAGTANVAVSQAVSGLEPGTTYHYRVAAANQYGSTEGADQTMTTLSLPTVTTGAASSVKANSATVGGTVNPEGSAATYQVEYGKTTSYGSKAPAKPASVGSGTSPVSVSEGVSGLEAGTTYHYRVVATNEAGTRSGEDRTFTTEAPPLTATQLAGMAVTDPFNGTTSAVSSFASGWSALGWSSGAVPKGENQTGGWHPSDAFSTVNGAYYSPIVTDTGPGIAASATMATNPSLAERYFSLWLDMGSPSAASRSGYELRLTDTAANTYTVSLSRWENGTRTILASQPNYAFANGNSFAIVDQGSTVSAWTNTGTGYAQLLSAADSTFSGGNAGVEGSGNITRLANFKVGSLLSPVSNMDGALKGLTLTDSFGANESPLSEGGVWSALAWDNSTSGHNTGQVSGGWGPYDAYATINGAFWQKATVPDTGSGSAVAATLTGNPTIASRYFSLWLDMPNPGSARSGYELRLTETSSNVYEVAISRWQSGERTVLASKTGYSFAVKGQFALAEKGGTVSAWTNSGSEFTQLLSATDAAFNRGYSGVEGAGNITRLTNFRSGPLPPF
jgi:Ca2+-binding RTX toxin-like protein